MHLDARFQGVDLAADKKLFPATLSAASGIASGSLQLSGSLNRPSGNAHVVVEKGEAYDEHFDRAQFDAALENEKWRIANGRLDKGAAVVHFSGDYQPAGQLHFKVDSNVFALSVLDQVRRYEPGLDAQTQIHLEASARITADHVEPIGRRRTHGISRPQAKQRSLRQPDLEARRPRMTCCTRF